MKVVQINFVFSSGSTGKIVTDIDLFLRQQGISSLIFYGRKKHKGVDNIYKFCTEFESYIQSLFLRLGITLEYGGCNFATWRLIRRLKKEKPDIVHLHCLNGSCVNIYRLLRFLGKNRIKTVVTHHAEFYYTGSCPHAYDCLGFANDECANCPTPRTATRNRVGNRAHEAWRKMRNAFATFQKGCLVFTAVSPWVKQRSSLSPIVNEHQCEVVLNGVDTKIFRRQVNNDLIKEKCPSKKQKFLFVSANFDPIDKYHNKGGWYIIELAKRIPEAIFIVVTPFARNTDSLPENVYLWGKANSSIELAELYSSVDLTLIASRRETFSMILAESLCCGTPVVGFKAGGPESIAIKEYCELVDFGDIDKYEKAVKLMLSKNVDRMEISKQASDLYGSHSMTQGYLNIYNKLLTNSL